MAANETKRNRAAAVFAAVPRSLNLSDISSPIKDCSAERGANGVGQADDSTSKSWVQVSVTIKKECELLCIAPLRGVQDTNDLCRGPVNLGKILSWDSYDSDQFDCVPVEPTTLKDVLFSARTKNAVA